MKKITIPVAAVLLAAVIAGMGAANCVQPLQTKAAAKTYTNYVSVPSAGSKLIIEPTLVFEPSSLEEVSALSAGTWSPASVILTPNAEMNVRLGESEQALARIYETYLRGKFIPVVRLSADTVAPFLDWLKNTYTVSDMMAISDDISVIETLYADDTAYLVNTVYDLTDSELSADRYAEWPHVAAANKAGCNILMYDASDANFHVACEYTEAVSKVCWGYAETLEEGVGAVASGAYGLVSANAEILRSSAAAFSKDGYARAQYIAAHRGITKYANEQSLTGIMASHNEGATHVEIDIQITSDGYLVSCHNSDINYVSGIPSKYIVNETLEGLKKIKLNNYSARYNESFATLEEICEVLQKTDVILIVELKLDSASQKALDLDPIGKLKACMEKYPKMAGHWITITFFAPYAKAMKEQLPEIPCCFLGAGASTVESDHNQKPWDGENKSLSNIGGKIEFLRKRNIGLDEMEYDNANGTLGGATNSYAKDYLARGYTMNTWTYESCLHFTIKTNIATTNTAEDCAMLVKEISNAPLTLKEADYAAGKVTVSCTTYNGWILEKECEILPVSREGNRATALLYLWQAAGDGSETEFGLYSRLVEIEIQ